MDIAEQFVFGMEALKDFLGEEVRGAAEACGDAMRGLGEGLGSAAFREQIDFAGGREFIAGDSDVVCIDGPEVASPCGGGREDGLRFAGDLHGEGVEERFLAGEACLSEGRGEPSGVLVNSFCDGAESFRAVPDSVHSGHDRQQDLGRADVAGGLVPADVLFAGLQAQAHGRGSGAVDAHSDEAAGKPAFEFVPDGHVGGVRSSSAHRHAETLGAAHRDVGSHFSGRHQQGEGQQIGNHHHQRTTAVELLAVRTPVRDAAISCRVLHHHREDPIFRSEIMRGAAGGDDFDAEGFAACADDGKSLRKNAFIDQNPPRIGHRSRPVAERDRFRGGRAFIKERRVGNRQRGQFGHHRLEVEEGLETALADFRLIWRVGGVPGRILENVPLDDRRRHSPVVSLTDAGAEHLVPTHDGPEFGQCFLFARSGRHSERPFHADGRRHGRLDERIERGMSADFRHGGNLFGSRPAVSGKIGIGVHGRLEERQ